MEFRKLNAPSLKELFTNEIRNMILSGKLEIGAKLPPERDLAESMHVSRAVVNAGITALETEGFLVVRPRIGTFVADYRRHGSLDTLVSIMNYNGGMLRDSEVKSILEVRIIFMSLAARLTVENASDEEIRTLEPYVKRLQICENPEETAETIFAFCHELAFISGNALLPLLFASFKDLVVSLWIRYAKSYGCYRLYESSLQIYEAVSKRDITAACTFIQKSSEEAISGDFSVYTTLN